MHKSLPILLLIALELSIELFANSLPWVINKFEELADNKIITDGIFCLSMMFAIVSAIVVINLIKQ